MRKNIKAEIPMRSNENLLKARTVHEDMIQIIHTSITNNTAKINDLKEKIKPRFTRKNIIKNAPNQHLVPIMDFGVSEQVQVKSIRRDMRNESIRLSNKVRTLGGEFS